MNDLGDRGSGELLDQGLDFLGAVIGRLGPDDWERPTPCAGWTARDLAGHVATSTRVAISSMLGQPPAFPDVARPGDLVDGDPAEFWQATAAEARDVLRRADLTLPTNSPLGSTVADDLAIPVIDLYVHAWDLGVTIGADVEIPADVIAYAHAYLDPLPYELLRGENRAFAAPAAAPADASPTERFIAWTGRQLTQGVP
ncbi:TIGR03086 family metal-binding protein [Actinocrispum sp. NPDC049592]|uniref:TIGR03086 family metal-binding protein n=1 Tax=Actinocrispum sp. NPDC049592 TaxID=3154835 RepID=UPI00342DC9AD